MRERSAGEGKAGQLPSGLCPDRLGLRLLCRLAARQWDHPPEPAGFLTSRSQQQPAKGKPASPSQLQRTQAQSLKVAQGTQDEHCRSQNWAHPGNQLAHTVLGRGGNRGLERGRTSPKSRAR